MLSGTVTVPALVLPYLGFLLIFVMNPLGWLLGIALPASALTFLIIRDIWHDDDPVSHEPAAPRVHWTARYGIQVAADQSAAPRREASGPVDSLDFGECAADTRAVDEGWMGSGHSVSW